LTENKFCFFHLLTLTSKKTDFIPCDSVAEKWFNKFSNRRSRSKRLHYCIAQVSSGSSRPHVVHTEIVHLAMVQTKCIIEAVPKSAVPFISWEMLLLFY
jgi:hypothetical protein